MPTTIRRPDSTALAGILSIQPESALPVEAVEEAGPSTAHTHPHRSPKHSRVRSRPSQRITASKLAGFPAIEAGSARAGPPLLFVHGDFGKIDCPVMVAGGAKDRIVAMKLVVWTARKLGVQARIYDNHAHWLLEQQGWQAIAADVAVFLAPLANENVALLRRSA